MGPPEQVCRRRVVAAWGVSTTEEEQCLERCGLAPAFSIVQTWHEEVLPQLPQDRGALCLVSLFPEALSSFVCAPLLPPAVSVLPTLQPPLSCSLCFQILIPFSLPTLQWQQLPSCVCLPSWDFTTCFPALWWKGASAEPHRSPKGRSHPVATPYLLREAWAELSPARVDVQKPCTSHRAAE